MGVLRWSGYTYREGSPIGGVRVRAYPVLSGGGLGTGFVETSSQSGTGYWELEVNTEALPSETGRYDIELYDPVTGARRWVRSGLRFQVIDLFGPSGVAPVPDQSVVEAKIRDGAVTDAKIGTRTLDDATSVAYANTGTLGQALSWLAKRIKEILGTASWRDGVPISLAALVRHASRHRAGGPDPITPDSIGAAAAVHSHPVATPTSAGFMSAADKAKLDSLGSGGGGGGGLAFRHVRVGNTDVSATTAEDRVALIAGPGIQLTADPVIKTVTIAVKMGHGSGLDADTVDGKHAADFGSGGTGGGGSGGTGGGTTTPQLQSFSGFYQSSEGAGETLGASFTPIPNCSVTVPSAGTYLVVGSATFTWTNGSEGYTAILGCRAAGAVQSYQPYKRGQVTNTAGVVNDMDSISGNWIVQLSAGGTIELVVRRTSSGGTMQVISGAISVVKLA
jgi:hypothetical protein